MSAMFIRRTSGLPSPASSRASTRRTNVSTDTPIAEEEEPLNPSAVFIDIPPSPNAAAVGPEPMPAGWWPRTKWAYERWLKKWVPLLLLVVYSLLGALVFTKLEHGAAIKSDDSINRHLDLIKTLAARRLTKVMTDTQYLPLKVRIQSAVRVVEWYETKLALRHSDSELAWDIWGALYYVGTIYTTIGYGNISPQTTAGRVMTMVYAIFGIPLVLAILSSSGKFFCGLGNDFWKLLKKGRRAALRRLGRADDSSATSSALDASIHLSQEHHETMPVFVALFFCIGWMMTCAGVFCIWEREWSYFDSFYFFFISLSTIGLGDVVPRHPRMLIFAFAFVIIGLSLVSMTINVIQMKIEAWLFHVQQMMKEEYERALAMGDCPERDAILAKIMKKQPWYLRNLMPAVVSEKQAEQLEQKIEQQFHAQTNVSKNSRMVQTMPEIVEELSRDDSIQDVVETANSESSPILTPAEWMLNKSMICAPDVMDKSMQADPEPSVTQREVLTQTLKTRLLAAEQQTTLAESASTGLQTSLGLIPPPPPIDSDSLQTQTNPAPDTESLETQTNPEPNTDSLETQTNPAPVTDSFETQTSPAPELRDSVGQTEWDTTARASSPTPGPRQEHCDAQTDEVLRRETEMQTALPHSVAETAAQTIAPAVADSDGQTDDISPTIHFVEEAIQTSFENLPSTSQSVSVQTSPENLSIELVEESDKASPEPSMDVYFVEASTQTDQVDPPSLGEADMQTSVIATSTAETSAADLHPLSHAETWTELLELSSIGIGTEARQATDFELQTSFSTDDEEEEGPSKASTSTSPLPPTLVPQDSQESQTEQAGCSDQAMQTSKTALTLHRQGAQERTVIETDEGWSQTPASLVVDLGSVAPKEEESPPPSSSSSSGRGSSATTQTEESESTDVEVQTTDSFLKIANRLDALKMNRAKSLAVMTVPKRPGKDLSKVKLDPKAATAAAPDPSARHGLGRPPIGSPKRPSPIGEEDETPAPAK